MAAARKTRVFMTGRGQVVRIPAEFRFNADEVYIRRDEKSGDVILSQVPKSWEEIFAEIDKAGIPPEFLADRNQGTVDARSR